MTSLIDLTVTLDPENRSRLPEAHKFAAGILAPEIVYMHPAEKSGRDQFCAALCCQHEDLPDGERCDHSVQVQTPVFCHSRYRYPTSTSCR